ncbi:MAG: PfkB family carbohydrate kinase [Planctomycetota bacterium]|nr:PfkB family carbohydrate kinase [Planctomycetota bacterium]MDA1137373.1 PfkB family carbohydrate kinase [Planctomycetota bacterium]
MPLTVVGSIALDSVTTPAGKAENALGGSATYFSMASSLFTKVHIVGVVGRDFPQEHVDMLVKRGIDTNDLQVAKGETFRWTGSYDGDMSVAETHDTQLNVFAEFNPQISEASKANDFQFLANIHPTVQRGVLQQVRHAKLTFMDTMNLWINTEPEEVKALLGEVMGIVLNDMEAKMLTGENNLVVAGKKILEMGPKMAVIKKGEHGATVVMDGQVVNLPAYPLHNLVDPTGAGDSFAGGMMGYLASHGEVNFESLRRGVAHGIVVATFTCEAFSLDRLKVTTLEQVEERLAEYRNMLDF